ncbi:MAG: hypothetical protein ACKPKO_33955, partial [Candidatus Fonsibacter sp.]
MVKVAPASQLSSSSGMTWLSATPPPHHLTHTTLLDTSCKIPPPPPKAAAVEAHDLAKLEPFSKLPALASGKRIDTWPNVPCLKCETHA